MRAAEPDRSRPPEPGTPRPLELPEVHRYALSSGIPVSVLERTDLPEVSLHVLVESGAATESVARSGVSELIGRLLTEGTARHSAQEMARRLDRMGASFRAEVGYDVTMVSMHLLSDVLPDALEYLRTVLREPAFDAGEVERVRAERLDEIEREGDQAGTVADEALAAAIYGEHPYGRPTAGLYCTVAGLDPDTISAFHRDRYVADGMTIIVCGDVRSASLRTVLEDHFGDWPGGESPAPYLGERRDLAAEADVVLVERPGSAQSEIRVGGIGMARSAEDFWAGKMANAVLGGLFNSRLNMNLRESKGWTYGARTSFRTRRAPGPFVAQTAVDTPVTGDALLEMEREIRGLAESPPDEREMGLARNALTLSLPRQFETVSQVGRKLAILATYDLADDYWERYRERIEAVTVDDVTGVAQRYLADPDRLTRVVVGDSSRIASDLEEMGSVEIRG